MACNIFMYLMDIKYLNNYPPIFGLLIIKNG
jgi:hypothetical protein